MLCECEVCAVTGVSARTDAPILPRMAPSRFGLQRHFFDSAGIPPEARIDDVSDLMISARVRRPGEPGRALLALLRGPWRPLCGGSPRHRRDPTPVSPAGHGPPQNRRETRRI